MARNIGHRRDNARLLMLMESGATVDAGGGQRNIMREHNWAGTYVFKAVRLLHPSSVDEVRRVVAGSPRIRAIGTRHSFNGIADSPGDLIGLGGLDPHLEIDRER